MTIKYDNMKKQALWHENQRVWKAFNKEPKLNLYDVNALIKTAFPTVGYSENRFLNVKGQKSPCDGFSIRAIRITNSMMVQLLKL